MDRAQFYSAVFMVVEREGRLLTMRRANTGYRDGWLGLPSGHMEPGETPRQGAIREALEEAGIVVKPEDLEFCHTQFYFGYPAGDRNYCNYFFKPKAFTGEPRVAEPHMASELVWATEDDEDLLPFVRLAWTSLRQGIMYSEHIVNKGEQP